MKISPSLVHVNKHIPTPRQNIVFGQDSLQKLKEELQSLGAWRVFLVTSPSIAHKTPLLKNIADMLGDMLVGSYTEVKPHSPLSGVFKAARQVKALSADCLISIGGGSSIDHTKAMAFVLGHGFTETEQLADHLGQFSGQAVDDAPLPKVSMKHIAIPTTGSAAEFTGVSGITDTAEERKFLIVAPYIAPNVVILDPSVTVYTPERLWLSTFVRSIDHAVEAAYGPNRTPYTNLLAIEAIQRFYESLPASKLKPDDLHARGNLQIAAWFSIWAALGSGVGLSHGLGYVLGGTFGVPHGICSCVMLSHVMDWNLEFASEPLQQIAMALGITQTEGADTLAGTALRALLKNLDLPTRLRETEIIEKADFPRIASLMVDMPHAKTNPRTPESEEEIIQLLEQAW